MVVFGMGEEIQTFLSHLDGFLSLQFETAINGFDIQKIRDGQEELLLTLKNFAFEERELEAAKMKWIESLAGSSASFGFPQLSKPKLSPEELERERLLIDASGFLPLMRRYDDHPFDEMGIGLSIDPSDWRKSEDVILDKEISPDSLLQKLFVITGFSERHAQYRFQKSAGGGFFMAAFLKEPTYLIGHGELNSLFRLSTLAHEVGHTTTKRGSSQRDRFLQVLTQEETILVSNEVDSYSYELIFLENLEKIIGDCFDKTAIEDFKWKLRKRKAIGFNLNLLSHQLNTRYFSGEKLEIISDFFTGQMLKLFPKYAAHSPLVWVETASLARPLSMIGYLRAYKKTFNPALA